MRWFWQRRKQRWEYHVMSEENMTFFVEGKITDITYRESINFICRDGWELFCISKVRGDTMFFFKRPV
jgi:hypothetical protein